MEHKKTGSLFRRFEDIEKEKIYLTYDYRTGRWQGDDSFMDHDGYGHYVGKNFEVWFSVYQTDYDNDGIPYWTEVNVLHTDPTVDDRNLDPDRDDIPTAWEWKWGYNPFVWNDHVNLDPDGDGIENYEEYLMVPWFSDPFSPDIYMEIDFMEPSPLGVKHELWVESQQAFIERFAQHGINVYIDTGWPNGPVNGGGEEVTFYETVSQDSGMMLQYYTHHFDPARRGIFHYYVVGHSGSFTHPSLFNHYDTTHLGTRLIDRLIFQHLNFLRPSNLRKELRANHPLYYHLPTPRTQRITLAGQFMHETGHQLGITPWSIEGCDNYSSYATNIEELLGVAETWGNYHSVMNYFWLYRDKTLLDYSDGTHGENDQNDWLEIYLPNFQVEEKPIIEDPDYLPPQPNKVVNESGGFNPEGWVYSEQLTSDFIEYIGSYSPMAPIKIQWQIYIRDKNNNDDHYGENSIMVYAQPIYSSTMIPDSEWTLISEGEINQHGEFSFTSQNLVAP